MSLIISDFQEVSSVDGEGNRFVLFFSGCKHNCPNCHNPELQQFDHGYAYEIDDLIIKLKEIIDWHEGITLSGGDPMYQEDELKKFLIKIRKDVDLKDINIWMYTGLTLDQIPKGITQYLDVIVDGKYIESLKPIKYRGSSNQKIWAKFNGTNKFIERIYNE